jgi:hypothetical protein
MNNKNGALIKYYTPYLMSAPTSDAVETMTRQQQVEVEMG